MEIQGLREDLDHLFPNHFEFGYTRPTSSFTFEDLPLFLENLVFDTNISNCRHELEQIMAGK